ncbi:2-C-methyl-D-erythritol 4-phosphate cytidylyltransferase [Candidatus Nitrosacidococcus tergens]|uniref:2-C-methyl-D-erythritol 4-phosphate cytidylyltransferase n=1 Tax=Candidatus Nitrosacidococcus tergens TaxID=553981 RepID=UPI0018D83B07|nr:2-C-methyl-D-erythritol 4-phosphate cytidylyltransferase [Candidatus Nitrosacidococcus tergens]
MSPNYWVVIPAAGIGKRMGNQIPKQYLPLLGKTVIEHTINVFLDYPAIQGIIVATSDEDSWWSQYFPEQHPKITRVAGGKERCHSVLNSLVYLQTLANPEDWVLVHDAARPCLQQMDLNLLIETLDSHSVGGLLALPVSDTLKRGSNQREVVTTVSRENLWRALTPQMFRCKKLYDALVSAINHGNYVTDEASAMEQAGYTPYLVEGHGSNIKITHPQDLIQAEFFLNR